MSSQLRCSMLHAALCIKAGRRLRLYGLARGAQRTSARRKAKRRRVVRASERQAETERGHRAISMPFPWNRGAIDTSSALLSTRSSVLVLFVSIYKVYRCRVHIRDRRHASIQCSRISQCIWHSCPRPCIGRTYITCVQPWPSSSPHAHCFTRTNCRDPS